MSGALLLLACGAPARSDPATRTSPRASESAPPANRATSGDRPSASGAAPEVRTDIAFSECHVSCCSPTMLAQQEQVAAETGDPTIAGECCMCAETAP
ncbi:MAG: hypothetical protein AB8I08_12435 [Sandaracinaceae bacterium]